MEISETIKKIDTILEKATTVFITGHKDLDLDAIGACISMFMYIKSLNKKAFLIIDDKRHETAVTKTLKEYTNKVNIIETNQIENLMENDSLLLIVDTNKTNLLQNNKLNQIFSNKLIIDHHELGEASITDATRIIDNDSSSTCEMLTEYLKAKKFKIDSDLATLLLSGIVLDTNNYTLKTGSKTFYLSYFLTENGASTESVQYLLKQDIEKYIKRQKLITKVKVFKKIAITKGNQKEIYNREELAKTADSILLFNEIEASFVIARVSHNEIGVSARSMGNINVGRILEQINGGGSKYEAASKISDSTTHKVETQILDIIKKI